MTITIRALTPKNGCIQSGGVACDTIELERIKRRRKIKYLIWLKKIHEANLNSRNQIKRKKTLGEYR